MSRYSREKKDHALSLMGPPQNLSVAEVAQRTGVTQPTLYAWRNAARSGGRPVPGDGSQPEDWKPEDKFAMVVETLGLADSELAEYGRRKGVFVEQILQWRSACMQATAGAQVPNAAAALAEERRRSRQLEKELGRKERALAEAAALLVLSRKLEALRNKGEDA
jgi:transposase-like protein